MSTELDVTVGPRADRVTFWPTDSGTYGVDATFQGVSGYGDLETHEAALRRAGVKYSMRQELDGGWTLRFGPLNAEYARRVVEAFIV